MPNPRNQKGIMAVESLLLQLRIDEEGSEHFRNTIDLAKQFSSQSKVIRDQLERINRETIELTESQRAFNAEIQVTAAGINATARAYLGITENVELYTRVLDDLERAIALGDMGDMAQDTEEFAAAADLAARAIELWNEELSQAKPGEIALGQQIKRTTEAMREQEAQARRTARAQQEHNEEMARSSMHLQSFGRGIAASLASFSLLAGGYVALGHLIGNFITESVEETQKLREAIDSISQLSPSLDTEQFFQDITDLENRLGIVSERITETLKFAIPLAGGDQDLATQITEQLTRGAQGVRQSPTSWADAATASLRAYNMEVEDLTRVQDILTVVMQNSAGQANKLLDVWGSVTKAAQSAHTPLEDNASLIITLAQHGGDLEENLRALKGAYDAMSTDRARDAMEELGIAMTDVEGNVVSFMEILPQLRRRIEDLPTGQQEAYIARIFQDRDVRNVMRTLINAADEVDEAYAKVTGSVGESGRAYDAYSKSAAAATERSKAFIQSLREQAGALIDVETKLGKLMTSDSWETGFENATNFFSVFSFGLAAVHAGTDAVEEFIKATIEANRQRQAGQDPMTSGVSGRKLVQPYDLFEQSPERQQQAAQKQAEGLASLARMAEQATAPILQLQEASSFLTDTIEKGGDAFVEWGGNVLASSSSLSPALEGLSAEVNSIYERSQLLIQGANLGDFANQAERDMAELVIQMQDLNREIIYLQNLQDQVGGDGDFFGLGALLEGVIQQRVQELQNATQKAEGVANQIRRESPEGQRAAAEFDRFKTDQASIAKVTAAQEELNAVDEKYDKLIGDLTIKQRQLQRELRDDSTPELAEARRKLDAATRKLEEGTESFRLELDKLDDELRDLRESSEKALAPLEEDLKNATAALNKFNADAEAVNNILADDLFELEAEMKRVEATSEQMLAPLIADEKRAADALEDIQEETERVNQEFEETEYQLRRALRELEKLEDATLDPLRDEIQGLEDQLYELEAAMEAALGNLPDLLYDAEQRAIPLRDEIAALNAQLEEIGEREADELRPIEDAMDQWSAALRAAQDEIAAISALYEQRLNPLLEEYNALQQAASDAERIDQLHQQQLGIENLAAQIASANAGSSDWITLNQEMAKQMNAFDRESRMFTLEGQIRAIEEERDAALEAAQERADQAERELELLRRNEEAVRARYEAEREAVEEVIDDKEDQLEQIEREAELIDRKIRQIERGYELERREIERTLREKERDLEMEERRFKEKADDIQDELDLLSDRRAIYNHDQGIKEQHAKDDHKRAEDALNDTKAIRDAEDKRAKDRVEAQNGIITNTEHLQEVTRRSYDQHVTDAKTKLDEVKGYWGGLIAEKQKSIEKSKEDAREFDAAAKAEVKTAQTEYKTLRGEIEKNITTIGDQIQAYKDQATEAKTTADAVIKEEQRKQKELANTWAWINAINNAYKNGVVVNPGDLPPGVTLPPGYEQPVGPPPPPRNQTPPQPPGPPNPPYRPPGGEGMGMVPPSSYSTGSFGGMNVQIGEISVPVSVSGGTMSGDLTSEHTWEPVAEAIYRSMTRVLSSKYAVKISVENS